MSQEQWENCVDYIEFNMTDVARAKEFYSHVFDWDFEDYGPEYTCFKDGRLMGGFQTGEVKSGGPLVVLYTGKLEDKLALVKEAGGEIVKEIFDFPGGRRFHFRDPSGNELAVWSEK